MTGLVAAGASELEAKLNGSEERTGCPARPQVSFMGTCASKRTTLE